MSELKEVLVKLIDRLRGQLSAQEMRNLTLVFLFLKYENFERFENAFTYNAESDYSSEDYIFSIFEKAKERNPDFREAWNILRVKDIVSKKIGITSHMFSFFFNSNITFPENYKEAFDDIIYVFFKRDNFSGNIFNTPHSVSLIFKEILGNPQSITDPCCGLGNLLEICRGDFALLLGQEVDTEIYALAKLRFAFNQEVFIANVDSVFTGNLKDIRPDAVVLHPPFNMKFNPELYYELDYLIYGMPPQSNANMLWLQLAINLVDPNGKAMVLLPNSSLSSGGREGKIREYMIDEGLVEAIISLPVGILSGTKVSASIWVLSKKIKNQEILVMDLSSKAISISKEERGFSEATIQQVGYCYRDWIQTREINHFSKYEAKSVSYDELERNDFSLLPNRYFPLKGIENFELDDAIELGKISTRRRTNSSSTPSFLKKISVKNLREDIGKSIIDVDSIETEKNKKHKNLLKGDAILISKYGDKLKPSYLPKAEDNLGYDLQNLYAIEIDHKDVIIDYLIQELNEPYIDLQLNKYRMGSVIKSVKIEDLFKVKIKLPSIDEQRRLVQDRKLRLIEKANQDLEEYRKELGVDIGDANSFLRHQVAGPLKNLRMAFKNINEILQSHIIPKNPEILEVKISENRNSNFADYLEIVNRDLSKVSYLVKDSNTTFDLKNSKLENLRLIQLVKSFTKELQDREKSLEIEFWDDSDFLEEEGIKDVIILGNKDLIHQALHNLVENAIKHALLDFDGKKGIYFQILFDAESDEVQVDVANTGFPISDEFTLNNFIRRGAKAGRNAGDGTGGNLIYEIMKKHNGHIDITNEQGPEGIFGDLATTFELYFPIKEFVKK